MKALILAAGAGTRLRPLTDTCPKPMAPIAGRPLLAWTLEWLRRYSVTDVALNLHHLPDVVREGLGDGTRFGMRLHYAVVHLQETFSDVVKTDKTGLSKTAHTRWMISAFANFLPGSTIFRLA